MILEIKLFLPYVPWIGKTHLVGCYPMIGWSVRWNWCRSCSVLWAQVGPWGPC